MGMNCMNDYLVKRLLLVACSAFIFSTSVIAATTEFLEPDNVINASANALLKDVKMFNTIGIGIALSIAECEGQDVCDATVDEHEIKQLISALGQRIDRILYRQHNNEGELTDIVIAYADTKAAYQKYVEKLSQMEILPDPEDLLNDPFVNDDVFEDFDEELSDDEDGLGEFEVPEVFEESGLKDSEGLEELAESEDSDGSEGSEQPGAQ